MSLDAVTLGARIAEARGRVGRTQADLAASASLDRSVLAKIETGSRRVTALELARIADALSVRVEWFVVDAPPAIVSRRNALDPGAPSPTIDSAVERLAREVEFLVEHDDGFRLSGPEPLPKPRSLREAEELAQQARLLMGLDGAAPAADLARLVAGVGLMAFALDLGIDSADAAIVHLTAGGVAVVNGALHVGRRRLALAHELGHYLVADEFAIDWRVDEPDDRGALETRLDRFARSVLLPESALRAYWDECLTRGEGERVAAVRTGSFFRVDMATLARRLHELRLASSATLEIVRRTRTTKADIIEFDLLVSDELAPPDLSRPYEQSVLRLYRSETISSARALEMLLGSLDEQALPDLPRLPANAIWGFTS
jgi:Zn-dependent peptidase ImmA (M78 family)/DNA-binding XRE family transcriptional regulator